MQTQLLVNLTRSICKKCYKSLGFQQVYQRDYTYLTLSAGIKKISKYSLSRGMSDTLHVSVIT